eukprot:scaffold3971_cov129-Isochrysis_galbana.AAC.1
MGPCDARRVARFWAGGIPHAIPRCAGGTTGGRAAHKASERRIAPGGPRSLAPKASLVAMGYKHQDGRLDPRPEARAARLARALALAAGALGFRPGAALGAVRNRPVPERHPADRSECGGLVVVP